MGSRRVNCLSVCWKRINWTGCWYSHAPSIGRIRCVATDIVSRGIDVDAISHVINYDLPVNAQDYVHRIGRTARAGASGSALSFMAAEESKGLRDIERLIGTTIPCEDVEDFAYQKRVVPHPQRSAKKPVRKVYTGNGRPNKRRNRRGSAVAR